MNIVICCINSKYIHSSLAPWCLLSGVKSYCADSINSTVIEGTINENQAIIKNRIAKCNPDIIGFCTYIWNVNEVLSLAKEIKKDNNNIKIILGGPEVSYNPYDVLSKNSFVDYIVSGEGEKSFAALINSIENDKFPNGIDGICYKENEKIILSSPVTIDDDPVSPYCKEYFDSLKGRIAYIETSRGCPYSCAFCLSGRCNNARFFDLEQSKKNIIALANSGAKTIKFVDRTFNANKSRAKEIIKFIISSYNDSIIPNDVCFHFEIAGDILDDETINLLNNASKALFQLEIGMQSFNEKTLSFINRKTDTKKLKSNILKLTSKKNMHIHIDLIAGLPYEDMASFKDSFDIGYSLNANMLQLGFLKLLHGADMREDKKKYPCTFNEAPPYEVTSTPWMSNNDINTLKSIEDDLDRIYNSGRFDNTLQYVIKCSVLSPFDILYNVSKKISLKKHSNISLDDYTALIFNAFSEIDGVDKKVLRDNMIIDRLSTNSSGKIPKCLQIEDKMLKKYKNATNSIYPLKRQNGKRGFAVIYTKQSVVFSDYESKDKITEKYELTLIPIKELPLTN